MCVCAQHVFVQGVCVSCHRLICKHVAMDIQHSSTEQSQTAAGSGSSEELFWTLASKLSLWNSA